MVPETSPVAACRRDAECHPQDPDRLQQLPSEILLDIFLLAPDFHFLQALINTSPRFSLVFEHNALRIVDSVLGSPCSGVTTEVKALMRAVVSVRTNSFRYTLDSTRRSWTRAGAVPLERGYRGLGDHRRGSPPPPPATLLRKFVGLAHNVHVLAHEILARCLDRCAERGLPLPYTPPSIEYILSQATCFGTGPDLPGAAGRGPGGRPEAAAGLGPPSWAEEQRVVEGLWMAQYLLEIRGARRRGDLAPPACEESPGWPEARPGLADLLWPRFSGELARSAFALAHRGPGGGPAELEPDGPEDAPREEARGRGGPRLPVAAGAARRFRLECPGHPAGARERPERSEGGVMQSPGYRLFNAFWVRSRDAFRGFSRRPPEAPDRPKEVTEYHLVGFVGREPYRELGFFFWDTERLTAFNITPWVGGRHPWLQVLGAEELASARTRAEEALDERQRQKGYRPVDN